MKKLLAVLTISLGLVGSANATDLIALATNGAFNEKSAGVKVLNNKEMEDVVGGDRTFSSSYYANTFISNPIKNNYYANTRPQTPNQAILSNVFMRWYLGK